MANEYVVNSADLISIAEAIREKGGTSEALVFPDGFISAIQDIQGSGMQMPQFTYSVSGGYTTERDSKTGDWKIRFLKSGKLKFLTEPPLIDICLVGGGGGSAAHDGTGVASGGGGYTRTVIGFQPVMGTEYSIKIGAGGTAGDYDNDTGDGGVGGTSSGFGYSAKGGNGGEYESGYGGAGGSGGNGYHSNAPSATDGGDGVTYGDWPGGEGQSTTTREFGETEGILYGSGGATNSTATPGSANTGNGGGKARNTVASVGATGGSGIVVIRRSFNTPVTE